MNDLKKKLSAIAIKIITRLYPFPGPYFAFFNSYFLHIKQAISLINEKRLDQKNIIIDVGAARGYVSGLFAKYLPETKIYAFEPIKASFGELVIVSKKFSNIIPVNKAMGAAKYLQQINVANRITASSLFELNPQNDDNFITQNINLVNKEEIEVSTIDDEIPANIKVNLIKLDVQGYEIEALKGAINTLKRTYIVLVEVSNHNYYLNGAKYYEIDTFLRTQNFELLSFIPSLRDKNKILEWDCIYINKELM
ncbi:MAG: FkbM family methyltransferase [Ginsengibacter sp.]